MTKPQLRKEIYDLISKETGQDISGNLHKGIKKILKEYEKVTIEENYIPQSDKDFGIEEPESDKDWEILEKL